MYTAVINTVYRRRMIEIQLYSFGAVVLDTCYVSPLLGLYSQKLKRRNLDTVDAEVPHPISPNDPENPVFNKPNDPLHGKPVIFNDEGMKRSTFCYFLSYIFN
jgi:hypothetical protein